MPRGLGCLLVLIAIIAAGFAFGRDYVRRHPQDVPWTALELRDPVGRFTASKLAGLGDEPAQCRAMLADAGTGDLPAPDRSAPGGCGYVDGVRVESMDYRPAPLVTSCPVAAALHLWKTRVVQPAARSHFGTEVSRIRHAGSYSCRRIGGGEGGRWSEHSTADAVDVTAFELAGGEQIGVLGDWDGSGPKAAFLRDVRSGACRIFSTVLSPDYNEAHRDHLHFDVANRGSGPWTYCR